MSRKNYTPHSKSKAPKHYDLAYTHLPEHPKYCRVVAEPLNTIYVNLDADFDADGCYVATSMRDPILNKTIRGKYNGWHEAF